VLKASEKKFKLSLPQRDTNSETTSEMHTFRIVLFYMKTKCTLISEMYKYLVCSFAISTAVDLLKSV